MKLCHGKRKIVGKVFESTYYVGCACSTGKGGTTYWSRTAMAYQSCISAGKLQADARMEYNVIYQEGDEC